MQGDKLEALKAEICRQTGTDISAGYFYIDKETGLWSIVADLDPHGLATALASPPVSDGGEWRPHVMCESESVGFWTPTEAASPSRPSPSPEREHVADAVHEELWEADAILCDLAAEPFGGDVWERSRKLEEYSKRAAAALTTPTRPT